MAEFRVVPDPSSWVREGEPSPPRGRRRSGARCLPSGQSHSGAYRLRVARLDPTGREGEGRGSVVPEVTFKLTFGSVLLVGICNGGVWTRLPTA